MYGETALNRRHGITWVLVLHALVAIFALVAIYMQINHRMALKTICAEDNVVECATALSYLVASSLFLCACSYFRFRNVWCWCYVIMLFIVAGEELNWGQRMLHFGTPEILQSINLQQEFNFHNITGIHSNVRMAGVLVLFTICCVMPIANMFLPRMREVFQRWKMPICPVWIIGVVLLGIAIMAYPRYINGEIIQNMDEVGELLLGIAMLAFAFDAFVRTRREHNGRASSPAVSPVSAMGNVSGWSTPPH